VIALTLELLDLAMSKCGNPIHLQICNKEFMNILISFLNQKNLPSQVSFLFGNVELFIGDSLDPKENIESHSEVGNQIREGHRYPALVFQCLPSSQKQGNSLPRPRASPAVAFIVFSAEILEQFEPAKQATHEERSFFWSRSN
jgi:hypothetical protein